MLLGHPSLASIAGCAVAVQVRCSGGDGGPANPPPLSKLGPVFEIGSRTAGQCAATAHGRLAELVPLVSTVGTPPSVRNEPLVQFHPARVGRADERGPECRNDGINRACY